MTDLSKQTKKLIESHPEIDWNRVFDNAAKSLATKMDYLQHRTVWTRGVRNRTEDGQYVYFVDYDMTRLDWVRAEQEHLQEIHNLGAIHIFKSSSKSFHAVSFDKLTAQEYMRILSNSSCDQAFQNVPRYSSLRNWVLRNFSKGNKRRPQYLVTVYPKPDFSKPVREQSTAHHEWFKKLYPELTEPYLVKPDGLKKLTIITYPTIQNKVR